MMHKKLANALMEHAMQPVSPQQVQHFAGGGLAGALGVGNSFDAQGPDMANQHLTPQVQQQYGQQQDVYKQQQGLAQQLQQQTMGQGPAQQLVAQQGANAVDQQAALMAGQRGASQNAGLVARQAAQAGTGLQQQAMNTQAGLAMRSQGALGAQQAQMASQALQAQGILQGAISAQNANNLAAQGINAQIAGQNAQANQGILGGIMQGLSGAGAASALKGIFAHGGEVPQKFAGGGMAMFTQPAIPNLGLQANAKALQQGFATMMDPFEQGEPSPMEPAAPIGAPPTAPSQFDSPNALPVSQLQEGNAPRGFQTISPNIFQQGGPVPGQARAPGDNEKNDIVPAMLSPGEIVLPRSVTQGGNVEAKAIEFLRHLKSNKPRGYGGVLEARKMARGGKA